LLAIKQWLYEKNKLLVGLPNQEKLFCPSFTFPF
jgi:hypothetical protein